NENVENFTWERPEGAPDIIKVVLKNPLFPGEKVSLNLLYQVKIPSEKFTRYGYDDLGNLKLKYWYITPAVFDEEWYLYSDKNLGDQYTPPANISIKLSTPPYLYVGTSLEVDSFKTENGYKTTYLSGEQKVNPTIYLTRSFRFESIEVNSKQIITNLEDDGLIFGMKGLLLNRILKFLETRLGSYPFEKIMVTREDYLNNPVYGLNQLPQFVRPYPDGFQYDIKQLKAITDNYLKNTLFLNSR